MTSFKLNKLYLTKCKKDNLQGAFKDWIEANEPNWKKSCQFNEKGELDASACSQTDHNCCTVSYTDRIINLTQKMADEFVKIQFRSLVRKAQDGNGGITHWASLIKRAVYSKCQNPLLFPIDDQEYCANTNTPDWLVNVPRPTKVRVLPKHARLEDWKLKIGWEKWPVSCTCKCENGGSYKATYLMTKSKDLHYSKGELESKFQSSTNGSMRHMCASDEGNQGCQCFGPGAKMPGKATWEDSANGSTDKWRSITCGSHNSDMEGPVQSMMDYMGTTNPDSIYEPEVCITMKPLDVIVGDGTETKYIGRFSYSFKYNPILACRGPNANI